MLKSLSLIVLGSLISTGVFAEVELRAKYLKTECVIWKNEVTRTMTFGKDKNVKFTETKKLSFQGIEAAARRAAPTSTGPQSYDDASYEMTIDGTNYFLNSKDSEDSLALIQLMVKACQI